MNPNFKNPLSFYNRIKRFIFTDLWAEDREASTLKRFLRKSLRICFVTVKGFNEGPWILRASALTFITLVSLVPLLAFILSISKGLGAEKILDQKINEYIFELPGGEATSSFVNFKTGLLNQIDRMDLTIPSAREDLLNVVEAFDMPAIPEDTNERTFLFEPGEPKGTTTITEPVMPKLSTQEETQAAVEDLKKELSDAIYAVDLAERNAKRELKERIEHIALFIPTNISLNAYLYKKQIMHFVERTSFGYLGAVGFLILMYFALRALSMIEDSVNEIWKIKRARPIFRRFSNYISILIVFPILLITSTAVTAALTSERLVAFLDIIWIGRIYLTMLGLLLPITSLWIAFSAIYILVPNTKVKFIPGIIGGIVGGIMFYLLQIFYFKGQAGLARYNVIYGAFAAVPLFIAWLQAGWIVVLFGVELTFVIQNSTAIKLRRRSLGISYASRELLGLILMERIVSQFLDGKSERWSDERLSESLNVPIGLIQDTLSQLSEASLIIEIPVKQDTYYVPGRDIDAIYVSEILSVIRYYGESLEPIIMMPHDQRMARLIDETQNTIKNYLKFTIKEVIQKIRSEEEYPPPH